MTNLAHLEFVEFHGYTWGGGSYTQTQIGDYSWYVGSAGGNIWADSEWKLTVGSESPGGGYLWVKIHCYDGSDPSGVKLMAADNNDPDLTGDTSGSALAIGDEEWRKGSGGQTYQTGYFQITIGSNSVDAYYQITQIGWGDSSSRDIIVWDIDDQGDLFTSGVQLGSRGSFDIFIANMQFADQSTDDIIFSNTRLG